jgi:hypothetical protein
VGNNIQGGASYSFIGGGLDNNNSAADATIGGGYGNTASGVGSFVGGGGSDGNTYGGNSAQGGVATIGGGLGNTASGEAATVPGGENNSAAGEYSFAAGQQAHAQNQGAFVWADSQNAAFSSTANDQFLIRAQGGVGIGETNPAGALHITGPASAPPSYLPGSDNGLVLGTTGTSGYKWIQSFGGPLLLNPTGNNVGLGNKSPTHLLVVGSSGGTYCDGNTWVSGSDRNSKADFAAVSPRTVLEKVSALPITEWRYKTDLAGTEHLGPMAQDFHTAFGLNGADDKHIADVDEGGVALAAIQGLNQELEEQTTEKDAEIQSLKQQNNSLAERLNALEATVKLLAEKK